MSQTNLLHQLAVELGYNDKLFATRRPYSNEVFKVFDIDLLPNAATDTLLGEIFDWKGRNWRSLEKNIVGYIAKDEAQLTRLVSELKAIPKLDAQVPDFQFTKREIADLDFKLPFLYDLQFHGDFKKVKDIKIEVNEIKRSRLTNIEAPGIEILNLLSEFKLDKTKSFRKNIKSNYVANTLFYAKSVTVEITKEAAQNIGVSFDVVTTHSELVLNHDDKQVYKLTYKNDLEIPFGAGFVKGRKL